MCSSAPCFIFIIIYYYVPITAKETAKSKANYVYCLNMKTAVSSLPNNVK
jgi:hypothetical protein